MKQFAYIRPDVEQMMVLNSYTIEPIRDMLTVLSGELLPTDGGGIKAFHGPRVGVKVTDLINPVLAPQGFTVYQKFCSDIIGDVRPYYLQCLECKTPVLKDAVKGITCPVCGKHSLRPYQEWYAQNGGACWVLYKEGYGDLVEKYNNSDELFDAIHENDYWKVDMITYYQRLNGSGYTQIRITQEPKSMTVLIAEHHSSKEELVGMREFLGRKLEGVDVREQSTLVSLFWYKAKQSFDNCETNEKCEECFRSYAQSVADKLAGFVGQSNSDLDTNLQELIQNMVTDKSWCYQGAIDNSRAGNDEGRRVKMGEVDTLDCVFRAVKFIQEVINNEID